MADPRPAGPPRLSGWRDLWRGFATLIAISVQAGRGLFLYVYGSEIASNLLGLFSTYMAKLIVDAAVAGQTQGVLVAAGAMAASRAAQMICGHLYVSGTWSLNERAQLLVDQRVIAVTAGVPGLEHEERVDYVDQVALLRRNRQLLGQLANSLLLNLRVTIQVVGGSLLLARIHPLLVLLPLFGVPPFLASKHANEIAERVSEGLQERIRLVFHLYERATRVDSGKELRLFGLFGELFRRHRRLTDEVLTAGERAYWQGTALNVAGTISFAVGYVGAIALVLWQAVNGRATVGDVVLATALAAQMNGHVATAVQMGNYFIRALRATGRYLWLVDYERAARARWADLPPAPVPDRLAGGITLEGVSFTYPGTDAEILRDVSVHLPAGRVVALVGENGAGKTTLVKLLSRFYDPTAGRILLDGVDLRRIDLDLWRARTTAAFQDFRQFEFLVRETVGIGNLAALGDGAAVQVALARAGAEDVPAALPAGLDTQLGKNWEGGVDLSGGQWQKLALGRAFMRDDPLLVVFDEPTAAIDAPTEHALFERFAAAARSGTSRGTVTLIVSHRFSTVRMADLILVLEDGRITEHGTHAGLMAQRGTYAELYDLQARAYR